MSGDDAVADLAAELRQVKARSGLSLKALEPLTHASDSALSRYLSGRALPPWPVVQALCQAGRVGGQPVACGAQRPLGGPARRFPGVL